MDFVAGDTVQFEFKMTIDGEKQTFAKGLRVRRGSKLLKVQKGSRQVCMERDVKVQKTLPNGKKRLIPHCCKCVEKTEAELFQDEMMKATGKIDQIEAKIRHAGYDEDGVPCCCVYALSQHDDFKAQKNAVMELIEKLGHLCVFLPKFHPELNFIQRYGSGQDSSGACDNFVHGVLKLFRTKLRRLVTR